MFVKVGDKVKVIAGASKGKEGKVIKTFKTENRVLVEGVNVIKKHQKPNNTNETGGILEREAPIHASNVKVIDSKKETKKAPSKTAKKEKKVA
ncbi:MAG TPA: 50S ribosomal protein L24 [Bacilli bacterium]|nr:50S ribosomal protein L24 [Bacilli bacterium]